MESIFDVLNSDQILQELTVAVRRIFDHAINNFNQLNLSIDNFASFYHFLQPFSMSIVNIRSIVHIQSIVHVHQHARIQFLSSEVQRKLNCNRGLEGAHQWELSRWIDVHIHLSILLDLHAQVGSISCLEVAISGLLSWELVRQLVEQTLRVNTVSLNTNIQILVVGQISHNASDIGGDYS